MSHYHAVVWIDHQKGTVWQFTPTAQDNTVCTHTASIASTAARARTAGKSAADHKFFDDVAHGDGAHEILIIGPARPSRSSPPPAPEARRPRPRDRRRRKRRSSHRSRGTRLCATAFRGDRSDIQPGRHLGSLGTLTVIRTRHRRGVERAGTRRMGALCRPEPIDHSRAARRRKRPQDFAVHVQFTYTEQDDLRIQRAL